MSESFNDGGPAFPRLLIGHEYTGMNVRTWLAGQALAGLCGNPTVFDGASRMPERDKMDDKGAAGIFAEIAVEMADATLAALAKEKV